METGASTTLISDLDHPDDAQYIWLPILVLVGVVVLAGLVYAMSRSRRPLVNCVHFKRRTATRNGYLSVDDEDSDVSMVGAEEDPNAITSLLDSRLHIAPLRANSLQASQVHINAADVALRV